MSKLVLSRDQLIPAVLCEDLYTACPEFEEVREMWYLVKPVWERSYRESCCGGDVRLLFPLLDHFLQTLRTLICDEPEAIHRLREYLGAKFGSAAAPTVIYYRKTSHGRPEKLRF